MLLLDLTLPTAEENLALDEALLDELDEGQGTEYLRFWELPQATVVVGRASRIPLEVRMEPCRRDGVPILRRCSGGLAIVGGPGCLMYSVVLDLRRRPHLRAIDAAHREVLGQLVVAASRQMEEVEIRGTSDVALQDRKFSGNSLRCKRHAALYHGTVLYDFDLRQVERYLLAPPRQPDYRNQRSHADFVTNVNLDLADFKRALADAWQANEVARSWPRRRTEQLNSQRYRLDSWNLDGKRR